MVFCDWLLSLSIIFFKADPSVLHLLLLPSNIPLYAHNSLNLYPSQSVGFLGYFRFCREGLKHSAARNIHAQVFV